MDDDIYVQCPVCEALIPYDEVQEYGDNPFMARCPDCQMVSPTDEFFS